MDASVAPVVGVVVVAAGAGTRLGRAEPKAFVPLAGRTLLEPTPRVVVVAPASHLDVARSIADASGAARAVHVVAGGDTRQASVAAGLAVLDDAVDVVLVHDAARCLTPVDQFARVVARAAQGVGVVPALPVTDTIKRLDADGGVLGTVDRSELGAVQTPQGFPRAALVAAYALAATEHTDDAALFAAAGHEVVTVVGDPAAAKITTPWDLERAAAQLGVSAVPEWRTGVGIDVHAFDPDAPLWLGGVHWPGEAGLAGHSDGDAVAHAICDALLSASGLGDIGSRFGVDDPRFADARGEVFLTATVELLAESGWAVGNVAVQLVANRPKFSPRREEVQRVLTGIVGAPVSVAATTSDGLGFTGRGEGVHATATALVHRRHDAGAARRIAR